MAVWPLRRACTGWRPHGARTTSWTARPTHTSSSAASEQHNTHRTLTLTIHCDTSAIQLQLPEIQYDTYLVRHRCKFFAHTNICKHVLAVNHMMEARKPEGERDQSLNLRLLTRRVSEKNLPAPNRKGKRGGGRGYAMRTGALLPQLPTGKSLGCKGHAKKNYVRKSSSTQPAKAAKKAIAKAPKTKAKAEAPKAKAKRPLPLAPIGSYCDGSPRLLPPRAAKKQRLIQVSSDEEDSSNDSEAADTVEAGRF